MITNLRQFNAVLRRSASRVPEEKLVLFQKKLAFDLLRGIVLKTPVDTGRARGNWQVTIGKPAKGVVGEDSSGGSTITQGVRNLGGLGPFQVVWIVNNLPYIQPLENGHSGQAPKGMVALTLAEVQQGL